MHLMTIFRIVFFLVKFALRHQENIIPILKSIWYFNSDIRISVAAILLLEKDGKYVLIKNHHREEYFAPIGGVYKHAGKLPQVLHDIEWKSDYTTHEPKVADMKDDLRGTIKGRHLARFLDWFVSRKGREGEQALFREIEEELSEGKVGKSWRERVQKVRLELVRHVMEGPRSVDGRSYQAQFRYFEIFQIDSHCTEGVALSNELWERAIRAENNLRVASREEIDKGRFTTCRSLIAGNTKYYFSSAWHGNEPAPY